MEWGQTSEFHTSQDRADSDLRGIRTSTNAAEKSCLTQTVIGGAAALPQQSPATICSSAGTGGRRERCVKHSDPWIAAAVSPIFSGIANSVRTTVELSASLKYSDCRECNQIIHQKTVSQSDEDRCLRRIQISASAKLQYRPTLQTRSPRPAPAGCPAQDTRPPP
jgi:hypothetical protein